MAKYGFCLLITEELAGKLYKQRRGTFDIRTPPTQVINILEDFVHKHFGPVAVVDIEYDIRTDMYFIRAKNEEPTKFFQAVVPPGSTYPSLGLEHFEYILELVKDIDT